MVGAGLGGGHINACAVRMLKCQRPLLWVSRHAHNYKPVSEVLILMEFALMALFFLSSLITNQCCLASYCEIRTLHLRTRAFCGGAAEEPARDLSLGLLVSPDLRGSPIPSPHTSLLFDASF